jgi:uncharacterized protein (TIGR02271 family)
VLDGGRDKLVREIVGRGFAEDDARDYAQAAGQGKKLLAAYAPEARVEQAVAIMERYEAAAGEPERPARGRGEQVESVPVAEEELEVGKRKVLRGGVRVTSRVQEQPVEETVSLREEHVEAERRPVDRKLGAAEAEAAFQDRVVEMTETTEELAVEKEARVVEEIALTKHAQEHERTVRDTVRHTEVEVEKIEPQTKKRR